MVSFWSHRTYSFGQPRRDAVLGALYAFFRWHAKSGSLDQACRPDGKTVAWNDFNTGFLLFDAATPRPMPLYSRLVHTNFASPSVDRKNHAFTDDSRFAFFREEAPSPRASIGRLQAVDLTNAQARVLAQLSDGLSAAGGSRVIFTDNLTQMSGMRAVGDLFIADLASPAAPTKIASHFVYGYGLDAKKKTLAYSVDGAKSGVYVVPLQ